MTEEQLKAFFEKFKAATDADAVAAIAKAEAFAIEMQKSRFLMQISPFF